MEWAGEDEKIIVKDKDFQFEAESEPGSQIWITNKPNSHPLLVQEDGNYFRKVYF